MSDLTIDFPLILAALVFGSGLLWLVDSLLFAPGRRRELADLQGQFPRWEQEGSPDAARYQALAAERAREPLVVVRRLSAVTQLLLLRRMLL